MEGAVYLLCAVTALTCSLLLVRGYRRSDARLLLWCAFFFLALTFENVLVFVDLIVIPGTDLSGVGNAAALIGTAVLLYGLIWEVK